MDQHISSPAEVRTFLQGDPRVIAPQILGAVLTHHSDAGPVSVRLTEVEAYMGPRDSENPDPGSHTFGGLTPRNAPMFGPPGFLYVYFTYGMHYCANIVCGPDGSPSALLLRAGEIVEGQGLAALRRPASKAHKDLASGPARLASALGLTTADTGRDALASPFSLWLPTTPAPAVASGPRVGVAGPGGSTDYPWRFWIEDDPTVSKYKAAKPRTRNTAG
ncbi:DNA-3-methyladenine glycosylase [Paenarthrobacter aurescens]|uniref:Putative 3-methyladenine DNA glycosylase n=2 Tax=Paenarthrobacter aurescens TaxID=43663 RepID=A0A4Y3ND90_PAEAU|nr:DNA-3-methyladenine glycosylase [Paenarthrobacter aurescens]MDO6143165.1 DNA-3-methyladenine glycosylase [Paenarthrobacter aurescens]MDO6147011.1 DNA-3-methyladenine glycosylase [Paenarthrobacter aurescens]MDO6158257.1 DNA-3-methyladenine glycosylase [Paenarthrobacter aurescens]MDO6162241.1 DNA-3-methyladenine glycosylase [Paenarthrobacter aurescens]GEB19672.1 putative 3-methyladenine DNA glycosylase [Paenarthrobacter aurescens]